jgi:hypothetical protein
MRLFLAAVRNWDYLVDPVWRSQAPNPRPGALSVLAAALEFLDARKIALAFS